MTKLERTNKIYESITAFSKDKYTKEELKKECELLEREIVECTFNGEHADYSRLKLWNVEKHLEQLNEEKGNLYNEQLNEFKSLNNSVIEMIKKYKSGAYGEFLASKSLKTIACPKIQIDNLELYMDDFTTELDSVIITEKGIYIVEVKNTKKDILIDEKGNYIRVSEYESFDCQIGEKMNHKEHLVREILRNNDIEHIKINSILVFTNSHINVTNNYKYIKHCFLSDLPHIIVDDQTENIYSKKEMLKIANILEQAEVKKEYFPEINMVLYKRVFSLLMSSLEFEDTYEEKTETQPVNKNKESKIIKWGYMFGLVATFLGGFATHAIIKKCNK